MVNIWKKVIQLKQPFINEWPSGSRQVPERPEKRAPFRLFVGFFVGGSKRIRSYIRGFRIPAQCMVNTSLFTGVDTSQVGFLPSAVLKLVSERVGSTTNQKKSPASRDSQSTHRSC